VAPPLYSPIKNSRWYLKQFKIYRIGKHIHTETDTTDNIPPSQRYRGACGEYSTLPIWLYTHYPHIGNHMGSTVRSKARTRSKVAAFGCSSRSRGWREHLWTHCVNFFLNKKLSYRWTNRAMPVCKVVQVLQDFLSEYAEKKFNRDYNVILYLSIVNGFRVIRCLSQCVSPKLTNAHQQILSYFDYLSEILGHNCIYWRWCPPIY